jgi:hypothetical protein
MLLEDHVRIFVLSTMDDKSIPVVIDLIFTVHDWKYTSTNGSFVAKFHL